ncbi:hypothetical protein EV643_15612 [Kribbella sp. VKM Ac-2527]|uniref:Uncharacterized protein n=1 Tax=Kribbella caucasensis TaxID=2512215 RepID=A0A4V6PSJ4_9ACTN|nr:SCO5918 family protein [Kribbella sp. VKM Ac-2527]TDO27528.1 hypothetical protein EV643_15612 [Kribbella sp. VKM Ac-2527]
MRFIVGGRSFDLTREQVEESMRGVDPDPIRKHVVEMLNSVFPPKQVFEKATGFDRASFTTNEAQRVLVRLGFLCRTADETAEGRSAWIETVSAAPAGEVAVEERLARLEAELLTAQAAIAGFHARLAALEG